MMGRLSSPVLRGEGYGDVCPPTRPIGEARIKSGKRATSLKVVSREQALMDSKSEVIV